MLCCRALYEDGVRVLLAEPVCLDPPMPYWEDEKKLRAISSFLEFMSADTRRWQSLRGLIFGHPTLYCKHEELLVEGIKQAPNIDYLELRNPEDLLSDCSDLRAALASLKNVKHLTICEAAKHTCLFLESVQWPLVTAKLAFADESWGDWDEPDLDARMHPAALLRGAQNTLVQLECQSWHCEYRFGNPTYPSVKSLSLIDIYPMKTEEWAKTYPNVSQLSVLDTEQPQAGGCI
ncbi:hypothetical protein C8Q74DRAFT_1310106 [Fomes fomentarius]|nr:hypothetical protein C8Q74DRAFT_1310106 [Fomes fomentarius]